MRILPQACQRLCSPFQKSLVVQGRYAETQKSHAERNSRVPGIKDKDTFLPEHAGQCVRKHFRAGRNRDYMGTALKGYAVPGQLFPEKLRICSQPGSFRLKAGQEIEKLQAG